MLNLFSIKLNEIYGIISSSIDSIDKINSIIMYKKQLNMDNESSFGDYYNKLICDNKTYGSVYTPEYISLYIIKNTISEDKIIANPFIKILDPSCGIGNFLIPLYTYLIDIYMRNIDEINYIHGLELDSNNIIKHIIDNNIFGYDIDEISIKALSIDLFLITKYLNIENINKKDFLLEKTDNIFQIIIGNPPYVGHKTINKEYSYKLKEVYGEIFLDKSDLSYCFFVKALKVLDVSGSLCFITSRYFMEAPSGKALRNLLINKYMVKKIIDFYGIRPFKGVGIDAVIILIENNIKGNYEVEVIKPKAKLQDKGISFCTSVFKSAGQDYNSFILNKSEFDEENWVLIDEATGKIVSKIEDKCSNRLVDICESFQGIISGCDRAFVVNSDTIKEYKLNKKIIKPWIKNSYIEKNNIKHKDKYIIYSDLIKFEEEYPNEIKYIEKSKDKLINRRECVNGVRKWYELQWGRKINIFEEGKIVFPYKASENRFAYDKGSYFSADIYCLKIKENSGYNYDFLLKVLNSSLYEFYFKTFAKKLGENQYEYYPNNLMKLLIPDIIELNIQDEVSLYEYFNLDEFEINLIKNSTIN